MARVERVLIVGGGMAGLSLAIALRQRGLSAEIVERADERAGTAAGLYLVGLGTRALGALGPPRPPCARATSIPRKRSETTAERAWPSSMSRRAARSGAGATGLMQVVPQFHRDKLAAQGGEAALLDPRVNALVGTWILKDSLRQAGNLRAGLQRYAGWQEDDEHRYASRVIAEKERLRRVENHALTEAQGESNAS